MNIPMLSNVKPDFESIARQLEDNLRNRSSWKDIYSDSGGETLIHFNSAVSTFDQWTLERLFKEAFPISAHNDSSIYAAAAMLGIRISRKIPGIQLCKINRVNKVNLPARETLIVGPYTQFYINEAIPFFNRVTLNYLNYSNELTGVYLYQGQVMSKTYKSDGTAFQRFVLPSLSPMSISDIDLKITIDGVEWRTIQDGLWNYGLENIVSDLTLGNGDVEIQFGNGMNGNIPAQGSSIVVTYVETLGAKQTLIANNSQVASMIQLNGYVLEGAVTKEQKVTLSSILSLSAITLANIMSPITQAYLPLNVNWDTSFVGLQLESSTGGLALIIGTLGNVATISIVSPFTDKVLKVGNWKITTPSTGTNEKSAEYYKLLSPGLKRADNKAITPQDQAKIIASYPGVSDVLVRNEKDLVRTTKIQKPQYVINNEISAGVYNGKDYYEVIENANPAFYNTLWISVLLESGLAWNTQEKEVFTAWLVKRTYACTIRVQEPIKKTIEIQVDLKCGTYSDPAIVKNSAETIIYSIFATTKPMLSKKVRVTDISKALSDNLGSDYDSCEIFKLVSIAGNSYTTTPLLDSDLEPSLAKIDSFGFPVAPEYLYLNLLIINTSITDR
jgi:hypothetical protein